MLCISPDIVKSWYVDDTEPKKPGGQSIYTDKCVEDLIGLKYLLGVNYRALEGFAKALLSKAGLCNYPVPDRTTINARANNMKIRLPTPKAGYVVSLDSTGLKIHGQREWDRKKHKQKDRANWVKMRLAIDNESMQILAVESTADDVQDPEMFSTLINFLPFTPGVVMGDGAYDPFNAYQQASTDGFNLVTPPKNNAVVHSEAKEPHIITRNEQVKYYKEKGIFAWAHKNGYWDRNRVETTMSRFVTTFSDRLSSRTVQTQQNDIVMKCHILNILTAANGQFQDSAA